MLVELALGACAPTPTPVARESHIAESTADLAGALTRATTLRTHLVAGQLVDGVDQGAERLVALAAREGATVRAREALRAAGDLYAARFGVTHGPSDLARADALYVRTATGVDDPLACAALADDGDLLVRGGSLADARLRYLDHQRRCPRAVEHERVVRAAASLDPTVSGILGNGRAAQPRWRRVVIDPGHGGSDPGARSANGLAESAVTLDVARRTAGYLADAYGIESLLTRDDDVYVALDARAERANATHADLFVSIHCNSSPNPESHGVSTYVLDTEGGNIAARLAARESRAMDGEFPSDPYVAEMLAGLRLTGQGTRAVEVARAIQHTLVATLAHGESDVDLGLHRARFSVLVGTRVPAVLVELPFLSHPLEAARLADSRYRDLLARAVAAGIAQRTMTDDSHDRRIGLR